MPSSRPELRRFVNEIVLGEECDEYNVAGMRRFISHFELYLLSMEEVKADTRPIRQFISVVNENGVGAALGLPIVPNFHYYLKRHTQLDAETHGPLALQLVSALCGKNDHREQEAMNAAEKALEARIVFWDGVEAAMKNPVMVD